MQNQTWKQIEGFENVYEISNDGEVKVLAREWKSGIRGMIRKKGEGLMRKILLKTGYYVVMLSKNEKRVQARVHVLVAKHFIDNTENKPCVNHKNGIKTDNRVENLEWCTYGENNKHALDNKLRTSPSGSKNGFSKKVVEYKDGKVINVYESIRDAANKTGLPYTYIWNRVRRAKNERRFEVQ